MSYRPAGYSSEEDDDEFGDFSFGGDIKSVKEKNAEIVVETYKKQLDINNTPENRFYNALMSGNVESVLTELNNGTDVNYKFANNYTPLFLVATHANAAIVEELLKRGADPKTNRDGFTVLMAVCDCAKNSTSSERVEKIIKQLLEYKVDVKAIDRKRRTALMLASSQGFPNVVQLLLPFSRLDGEDNQGWTALFYAVNANNPEVIAILIDAGANVNQTDVRLNDVKYYATISDFQEVLTLLPKGFVEITADDLIDKEPSLELMFENLQENERPLFMNDVSLMLYGMRCESLIPLFQEKKIGLDRFLSVDDQQLQDFGIKLSFQRARILKGLYKFHKHPFKQRSMPAVCTDKDYRCLAYDSWLTYDILITVANCIKHLTVMEASLKYMRRKLETQGVDKEKLQQENISETTRNMLIKFHSIKYATNLLKEVAVQFDVAVPSQPDCITKNKKFRKQSFKWWTLKWLTAMSISTLPIVVFFRIYRSL